MSNNLFANKLEFFNLFLVKYIIGTHVDKINLSGANFGGLLFPEKPEVKSRIFVGITSLSFIIFTF